MSDINDADRCMAALEPGLDKLAEQYPGGGVFAYWDGSSVHGSAHATYEVAERNFAQLSPENRSRGIILQLLGEHEALTF